MRPAPTSPPMPTTSPAWTWKLTLACTRGAARDARARRARPRRSRLGAVRDRAARPCGRPCARRARRCGVSAGQAGRHRAPVGEHRHAVADPLDLVEAVRDVDDAHALGREPPDDPEQRLDLAVVEDRGRLVHDQQPDVARQRAGDRDDLLRRGPQRAHEHRPGEMSAWSRRSSSAVVSVASRSRSSKPSAARLVAEEHALGDASGPRRGRAPDRSSRRRAPSTPTARRRAAARLRRGSRPRSGATTPDTHLISVDLPAPLGPSRQCTSPGAHVEVHALEGLHARVLLRDPADLEQRCVSLTRDLRSFDRNVDPALLARRASGPRR